MSRQADLILPGNPARIASYRLEGRIGRGATGVVYAARDGRLGRRVALKVVAPELAGDAAFRDQCLREPLAAAAVGHPNILPVYDAGEASGMLYLAMRYVEGGPARSLVSPLGPLDVARAWSVIAQVASALDAAHDHGLIHRDVKPGSMLLDTSAEGGRTPRRVGGGVGHVFLSDFGMSRNPPPVQATAAGQFTGTLDYLAPEQIEGRALDGRADLYSLACAGFELLCGTPPFGQDQGATVMYAQLYAPPPAATARRPDLPAAVDQVLARALAKSPADRYPTCAAFAEELRAALGLNPGEQASAAAPRSPEQVPAPVPQPVPLLLPVPEAEQGPELSGAYPLLSPPVPPAAGPAPVSTGPVSIGPVSIGPVSTAPVSTAPVSTAPVSTGPVRAGPLRGPGRPDRLVRRRRLGVAGVILAVAVIAIVAAFGVAHSGSPAPGTATPSASSPATSAAPSLSAAALASKQAAAVDTLLGSSASAREALQGGVRKVRGCSGLSGAVAEISGVVTKRAGQYNQASALSVSALIGGATVKSDLITALHDSLAADRDYLTWAQQQLSSGCTPAAQSGAYNAAVRADEQADASKQAFVRVWNPVAARYGVPRKSPSDI